MATTPELPLDDAERAKAVTSGAAVAVATQQTVPKPEVDQAEEERCRTIIAALFAADG